MAKSAKDITSCGICLFSIAMCVMGWVFFAQHQWQMDWVPFHGELNYVDGGNVLVLTANKDEVSQVKFEYFEGAGEKVRTLLVGDELRKAVKQEVNMTVPINDTFVPFIKPATKDSILYFKYQVNKPTKVSIYRVDYTCEASCEDAQVVQLSTYPEKEEYSAEYHTTKTGVLTVLMNPNTTEHVKGGEITFIYKFEKYDDTAAQNCSSDTCTFNLEELPFTGGGNNWHFLIDTTGSNFSATPFKATMKFKKSVWAGWVISGAVIGSVFTLILGGSIIAVVCLCCLAVGGAAVITKKALDAAKEEEEMEEQRRQQRQQQPQKQDDAKMAEHEQVPQNTDQVQEQPVDNNVADAKKDDMSNDAPSAPPA